MVKKLNRNAIKKNYEIDIYGNNYSTKDGTCIRDYIDVNDLSNIHIDVMKNLLKKFQEKYGEGSAADLDYGKLLIIGLLIYIAFFKEFV